MSKRKPKFPTNKVVSHTARASGVTMSKALFAPRGIHTIKVSSDMLQFVQKMAGDPYFRAKVAKLL
jgi:hypothetical protein